MHKIQKNKEKRQNGKEKDRYFWFLLVPSLLNARAFEKCKEETNQRRAEEEKK